VSDVESACITSLVQVLPYILLPSALSARARHHVANLAHTLARTPQGAKPELIPPEMITALHDAVGEAVAARDARHHRLKDAVCAIVDVLKASGEPPERVLMAVRKMIHATDGADQFASVADYVVGWCLDRYFHAP
jgi:hypothetical protein